MPILKHFEILKTYIIKILIYWISFLITTVSRYTF